MIPFAAPVRVFARGVSSRYSDCLRSEPDARIDVGAARAQHAAYVETIRSLGIAVTVLPADDASPDCCFIEDTAVVLGMHAVATRPGAASRHAEVEPVAAALGRDLVIHRMVAPAALDGGDVLRVGPRLFVGLSTRTNRAGAEVLARVASLEGLEVVPLAVRGGLHLKSACTLASASLLLYDAVVLGDESLDSFGAAGLQCVRAPESLGANVLALGEAVLVSAAAPQTARELRGRGLDVRTVDVSEMHKGDGALTCLSLRVPGGGCWST